MFQFPIKDTAMSRVRTPDNINIASLKQKQAQYFDPMAAGPGTPWEDRGSNGVLGAFLKTCKMSMSSPALLLNQIRRPETTSDTTAFLIGCCIICGASALIHGLILMPFVSNTPNADFDQNLYIIYCAIAFVAAGAGLYFLFRLYNIVYAKLIAQEKTQSVLPAPLLYNVTAYALGPSLLALIPFVGPPIALAWIFINLILAGSKRLRIRASAAFIDALLAFIVVAAVGAIGYWVGDRLVLHQVLGETVEIHPPKKSSSGF
jgi:hypothetical protein